MKKLLVILIAFVLAEGAYAQINAKLMRYMDVSDTQITFVYGGDIWIVSKDGGMESAKATDMPPRNPPHVKMRMAPNEKVLNCFKMDMGMPMEMNRDKSTIGIINRLNKKYSLV